MSTYDTYNLFPHISHLSLILSLDSPLWGQSLLAKLSLYMRLAGVEPAHTAPEAAALSIRPQARNFAKAYYRLKSEI